VHLFVTLLVDSRMRTLRCHGKLPIVISVAPPQQVQNPGLSQDAQRCIRKCLMAGCTCRSRLWAHVAIIEDGTTTTRYCTVVASLSCSPLAGLSFPGTSPSLSILSLPNVLLIVLLLLSYLSVPCGGTYTRSTLVVASLSLLSKAPPWRGT